MSCILLFNLTDEEKKTAIRLTAMRYGTPCFEVPPEQQGQTIEALLNGRSVLASPCRAPFADEMMVMNGLTGEAFHSILDTLRREGKSVRLKAVVTDHNRAWTALRLHREISTEAAAMEKAAGKRKIYRNNG